MRVEKHTTSTETPRHTCRFHKAYTNKITGAFFFFGLNFKIFRFLIDVFQNLLAGAVVFGDGLGTFRDSVFR